MKRFIRFVCAILAIVMIPALPVSAVETTDQRGSDYFMAGSVYLEKISNKQFKVWFDITALDIMDELGASKIEVQWSTDEENWSTVYTYNKSVFTQMTGENELTYANYVTHTYTSGYYYRAVVTLYAKLGNGSATSTRVTPTLDLT